jgi:hypothetical protein
LYPPLVIAAEQGLGVGFEVLPVVAVLSGLSAGARPFLHLVAVGFHLDIVPRVGLREERLGDVVLRHIAAVSNEARSMGSERQERPAKPGLMQASESSSETCLSLFCVGRSTRYGTPQ